MNIITITKLNEFAQEPEFLFPMAMGYNVFASETNLIEVGRKKFVKTGISIKVPEGSFASVVAKPSFKTIGVETGNMSFDSGFEGELKILLTNMGNHDLPILIGDKIAMLAVLPIEPPIMVVYNYDYDKYLRRQNEHREQNTELQNIVFNNN